MQAFQYTRKLFRINPRSLSFHPAVSPVSQRLFVWELFSKPLFFLLQWCLEMKLLHYLILLLPWEQDDHFLSLFSLLTLLRICLGKLCPSLSPAILAIWCFICRQFLNQFLVPAMFFERRFFNRWPVSNHLCVRGFTGHQPACDNFSVSCGHS